jgi:hypothetical protein
VEQKERIYLKADIQWHDETAALKEAASIIELPKDGEKQIDLQYFSAIFVSSGANLNHAYFLPSELVKAEDTIVNKAMDLEHKEEEIVGHIYDRVFMDKSGNKLSLEELSSIETSSLDQKEIHVAIAGIVYKNRFPELAKEIADGEWCVSMEAYFGNYDVKIGDLILTRKEAEALGLATDSILNVLFGKTAKVIKNKVEIATGTIDRVLRNISFSGCGFVKKPANPSSVVLETAADKGVNMKNDKDTIVLDYDKLTDETDINLTSDTKEERSNLQYNDTVGICVSYKKEVYDSTFKDGASTILHNDWCALYEKGCTSFSRDTTDPKCLRNQIEEAAVSYTTDLMSKEEISDKRKDLLDNLNKLL